TGRRLEIPEPVAIAGDVDRAARVEVKAGDVLDLVGVVDRAPRLAVVRRADDAGVARTDQDAALVQRIERDLADLHVRGISVVHLERAVAEHLRGQRRVRVPGRSSVARDL